MLRKLLKALVKKEKKILKTLTLENSSLKNALIIIIYIEKGCTKSVEINLSSFSMCK